MVQSGSSDRSCEISSCHTQKPFVKARPPPRGAKISHSKHKAATPRINDYDWYEPLPARPEWEISSGGQRTCFSYERTGQLRYEMTFDTFTFMQYCKGCRQQGIPLRLWVQHPPTMHADRFAQGSHRCRWEKCPVNNNISRGEFQVSLDEYPDETSNGRFDPFHVAGFMHLYCLEKMIESEMGFIELMGMVDVQLDSRNLPLEAKNPMDMNKGRLPDMFSDWCLAQAGLGVVASPTTSKRGGESQQFWRLQYLFHCLTDTKMADEPNVRRRIRAKRGGNDISKHHGNLALKATAKIVSAGSTKRKRGGAVQDTKGDAGTAAAVPVYDKQAPRTKRRRSNQDAIEETALINATSQMYNTYDTIDGQQQVRTGLGFDAPGNASTDNEPWPKPPLEDAEYPPPPSQYYCPLESAPSQYTSLEDFTLEYYPPLENSQLEYSALENLPLENSQLEYSALENLPLQNLPLQNSLPNCDSIATPPPQALPAYPPAPIPDSLIDPALLALDPVGLGMPIQTTAAQASSRRVTRSMSKTLVPTTTGSLALSTDTAAVVAEKIPELPTNYQDQGSFVPAPPDMANDSGLGSDFWNSIHEELGDCSEYGLEGINGRFDYTGYTDYI